MKQKNLIYLAITGAILSGIVFFSATNKTDYPKKVRVTNQNPSLNTTNTTLDRSTPQTAFNKVKFALIINNTSLLYQELSPELRKIFTLESLIASEKEVIANVGKITDVQIIEPLTIRTDGDFNGEWADATIKIKRKSKNTNFLARFHLENDEWWFYGTSEIKN